jgi:hypothetical protein
LISGKFVPDGVTFFREDFPPLVAHAQGQIDGLSGMKLLNRYVC